MNTSVELFRGHELQLAFHYAIGYEGFDYFKEYDCWRAEMKYGDAGICGVSIINAQNGRFRNRAYYKDLSDTAILRELRSENIGLQWDDDSYYELYFQALPEIRASAPDLASAYMKVMVKKRFGDSIPYEDIEKMNLLKTRTKEGHPL